MTEQTRVLTSCVGTYVEDVVVHRAWCPTHGVVGPLRENERDANDDADDHYFELHGEVSDG